ncbi:hypothetical protein BU24DRAFT_424305 [Aaosphaeria arxii CBS 175.79]|uniref:C2H2-type domain-containing protein n=1 Tax=Aaosphaeria arxii CBS 175.79 TaxID=1450172 RepID=A0A6A5XKP0_9PLEO|nr:uncharacterized protein BU24DRAFT_424305 [Aaosphaeria arxii CBS 175.79]KAF2013300.1 hypothetical protein BU24DRAFT_424305 [Aaosphaeria arxii CBS 175.79]
MEPLAKRLRRHSSLEVDESNPDYVREKRKAEARLKSQFESIFAKYENMPESMSDEIDMQTGTIVVDRGHLRSLENNAKGWRAAQFLDDLLPGDSEQGESIIEDSEDELAPPISAKTPKANNARKENESHEVAETDPTETDTSARITENTTPSISNQSTQIPTSVNPFQALPFAQFPQTPLIQNAQNTFLAGLNQVISQAVSQYTSHALSNYFKDPTATASAAVQSTVTPATEPTWWFPSLPNRAPQRELPRSSPIIAVTETRKRREGFSRTTQTGTLKRRSHPPVEVHEASKDTVNRVEARQDESEQSTTPVDTNLEDFDRTPKQAKKGNYRLYKFTDADDGYIARQKELNQSWARIQMGRPSFQCLPLWYIQQHYYKVIKHKKPTTSSNAWDDTMDSHLVQEPVDEPDDQLPQLNVKQHQLLTPNSVQQAEVHIHSAIHSGEGDTSRHATLDDEVMDQEDLELLSLANNSPPPENFEIEDIELAPDEIVLPSIELEALMNDDHDETTSSIIAFEAQAQILNEALIDPNGKDDLAADDMATDQRLPSEVILDDGVQPPNDGTPVALNDLDHHEVESSPIRSNACEGCGKSFRSLVMLQRHKKKHSKCCRDVGPARNGIDGLELLPLETDKPDELDAPHTPIVKREPLSPGSSSIFAGHLFSTPKSAPQSVRKSSEKKSSAKLGTAERLKIRQSWAKAGRKSGVRPQRSFQVLQKRKYREETDEQDELA